MEKLLVGSEFKREYAGIEFYKLTNEIENHNGYQFKTGLNVDTIKFNPVGGCQAVGIYFTDLANVMYWLEYKCKKMKKIRKVIIPDDAMVYIGDNKFKADKLILGESVNLDEFLESEKITYEMCLEAIKKNWTTLEFVPDKYKTEEMCKIVIGKRGYELKFVPEVSKTLDVCNIAVTSNGYALKFVPDKLKSLEICQIAVASNGCALKYVPIELKDKLKDKIASNHH